MLPKILPVLAIVLILTTQLPLGRPKRAMTIDTGQLPSVKLSWTASDDSLLQAFSFTRESSRNDRVLVELGLLLQERATADQTSVRKFNAALDIYKQTLRANPKAFDDAFGVYQELGYTEASLDSQLRLYQTIAE